jgi:hypothetical protein
MISAATFAVCLCRILIDQSEICSVVQMISAATFAVCLCRVLIDQS